MTARALRLATLLLLSQEARAATMTLSAAAALLKVPIGASRNDVRAAYRRQAALSHPDVAPGGAQDILQVQAAYGLCLRFCQTGATAAGVRERDVHTSEQTAPPPSAGPAWRDFTARREDVAPDLFSVWHAYWHVELARRTAAARVELQRATCSQKESELRTATGDLRAQAATELAQAQRELDYLVGRHSKLRARATTLEAQATGYGSDRVGGQRAR